MNISWFIFVDVICDIVWISCPFMVLKFKKNSISAKILAVFLLALYVFIGLYSRLNEGFYNDPLKTVLTIVVLLLFYVFCFEDKLSRKLMTFVVFWVTIAFVEIFGIAISLLFGIDYKNADSSRFIVIILLLFQYLLFILYRNIYQKYINKIKLSSNLINFDLIIVAEIIAGLTIAFLIDHNLDPLFLEPYRIQIYILLALTLVSMLVADISLYKILIVNSENYELKRELETAAYKSKLELDYYKKIQSNIDETNKLNHDMTNLVASINSLIYSEDISNIKEAREMTEDISKRLMESKQKQYCRNELVNLIILNKEKIISDNNIEFTANINISSSVSINSADLCSVFTNILDNATDACLNAKNLEKSFIVLNAEYTDDILSIECSNYNDNALTITNNKIVTTKKGHKGLGLEIIKSICNKYNGTCTTECKDNLFTIKITLHSI